MRLAFYAPMKSPDHPVPSGDRTIARALITALDALGAEVSLASTFRSRDGAGDAERQEALIRQAEAEVSRVVAAAAGGGWDAWITYHNYYKAPDLIGPAVARALNIPYLLIEATRARKRLTGPWARFARRAEAATDAAAVVYYFSKRDAEALRRDAPAGQHLVHLRPFLTAPQGRFAPARTSTILCIGMMRDGDKRASYKLIAETLALLPPGDWDMAVAGDGPARAEVESLLHPFASRIRYLGERTPEELRDAFAQAGIFLWPGVNEALGMVYLEAQAAGLPVVAQDRPGMRDVLAPGPYPPVERGPEGLADMLQTFLADDVRRQQAGRAAHDYVAAHHLLPQATETLARGLAQAGVRP